VNYAVQKTSAVMAMDLTLWEAAVDQASSSYAAMQCVVYGLLNGRMV
jgi:hypothetical protein